MGDRPARRGIRAFLKRLFLRCTLVFAAIFFAFVVAEIAFRLFQPGRPDSPEPQVTYTAVEFDADADRPFTYWTYTPQTRGFHYEAEVTINSLGLRNPEIVKDKPKDTYRIVALGDSHTFGFGVAEPDSWPRQLEHELQGKLEKGAVEVINGGVGGLAIEQELQLFRERLLDAHPDLVVMAYYWNDMPMPGDPAAPWPDGKDMEPVSRSMRTSKGKKDSRTAGAKVLAWLKKQAKKSYVIYNVVQRVPGLQMSLFPTNETKWKRATLQGETTARTRASWRFVETQLLSLRELGKEHGFDVLVVVIPLFEQMVSDAYPDASYPAALLEITKRAGIDTLDPREAIRAIEPSYPEFFVPFDGHPNGKIYTVIARQIATHLLAARGSAGG